MDNGRPPSDPRWPRVLSHAAHELRTPVGVVLGYLRMLLRENATPLADQQRHMLQEVEKSTGRIKALTDELSDLAKLETGEATFDYKSVDLGALIEDTISALPPLPDREITITLDNQAVGAMVEGDRRRLSTAFAAILFALRRELVTSTHLLVRLRRTTWEDAPVLWIAVAGNDRIDAVDGAPLPDLGTFREDRGGCGLMPSIAERIIAKHDGRVSSPFEHSSTDAMLAGPASLGLIEARRASAVIVLPER